MFDKDDFTWGGFIKSNIRRFLLKEMLESGDPENMFRAIRDCIEEIEDEINDAEDTDKYWDKAWDEVS